MIERRRKVQVWVFCREEGTRSFLLLRTNAARGGFWQPVTGSVEEGEEIPAAAAREMKEETGLSALSLRPVSRAFEFESRGKLFREHPFLAEVAAGARGQLRIDPREHDAFEWVGAEQALGRLGHESNARVLKDALGILSTK